MSLMDDVMDASRGFFHQPLEEKQKYSNLIDGKRFQVEGYGNDRVATEHQILNWNDRLHLKVAPEDERNYTHWPNTLNLSGHLLIFHLCFTIYTAVSFPDFHGVCSVAIEWKRLVVKC